MGILRPGRTAASTTNAVSLKSKNPKPLVVAVLGNARFALRDILPETVQFGDPLLTDPDLGGTGDPVGLTAYDLGDVNDEGMADLVLEFDVTEMKSAGAIDDTSSSLMLTATLGNGGSISGIDLIYVKGSHGKGPGGP